MCFPRFCSPMDLIKHKISGRLNFDFDGILCELFSIVKEVEVKFKVVKLITNNR